MAAIPLVITTLDLVATPLVVSTIMKGNTFQFQFRLFQGQFTAVDANLITCTWQDIENCQREGLRIPQSLHRAWDASKRSREYINTRESQMIWTRGTLQLLGSQIRCEQYWQQYM